MIVPHHPENLAVYDGSGSASVPGATAFTDSARSVIAYLNEHTPLTDWSVARIFDDEQVFVHVYHEQFFDDNARMDWNQTFCKRMVAGAAHVVPNTREDPDYSGLEISHQIGSYAGYMIPDENGNVFGVLCGGRREPLEGREHVDEDLLKMLSGLLASQLRLARDVDRERERAALAEARAHTDPLTGLLNRRGWMQNVENAQQRISAFGDPIAVAIVDLDNLKSVNDTHGHGAGDAFLIRAAHALQEAAGTKDRVARIGGDEFAILAHGVSSKTISAYFERFSDALSQARVPASIGFSLGMPHDEMMQLAIDIADAAMYAEKAERRSHQ